MTLGFTNGTTNAGLFYYSGTTARFGADTIVYGTSENSDADTGTSSFPNKKSIGITNDSTKSGIVADLSSGMSAVIKY